MVVTVNCEWGTVIQIRPPKDHDYNPRLHRSTGSPTDSPRYLAYVSHLIPNPVYKWMMIKSRDNGIFCRIVGLLGSNSRSIEVTNSKSMNKYYQIFPNKKYPKEVIVRHDFPRQSSDFLSNFNAVNYCLTTIELKITSLFLLVSSRNMAKTFIVERTRDAPSALYVILYGYKSLLAFFISYIGTRPKCSDRKSAGLEHTYVQLFEVLREEEH